MPVDEMSNIDKFLEATKITASKYSLEQINLNGYLFNGDLGTFTRSDGARLLASTINRNMLFVEIQYHLISAAQSLTEAGVNFTDNSIINGIIGNAKNDLVNGNFSLEKMEHAITMMIYHTQSQKDLVNAISGNITALSQGMEDLTQVSILLSQYMELADPDPNRDSKVVFRA